MRYRANAANTLNNMSCIFRSTILYNKLHAAEAATGNPSVRNNTVFHFSFNTQVTFNTGYRVDYCTCHVLLASLQDAIVILADSLIRMLCVPFTYLFEIGTALGTAGLLHAKAMDYQSSSNNTGQRPGNSFRLNGQAADTQIAETSAERSIGFNPVFTRIIRVCRAATDAGTTRRNAP